MILRRWLGAVSWFVLVTFTSLCIQPAVAAIRNSSGGKVLLKPKASAQATFASLVASIEDLAKTAAAKRRKGDSTAVEARAILASRSRVAELQSDVDSELDLTTKALSRSAVKSGILQRHADLTAVYHQRSAELDEILAEMSDADARRDGRKRDAAMERLSSFFNRYAKKRSTSVNPAALPWRTVKAGARVPWSTSADLVRHLPVAPSSSPKRPATLKSFGPDDLAETQDVQITDAVRAQAAAFNGRPLDIFNWVRNNVDFVPTYGSVQGSDLTLAKMKGNAFDTASLLIALLRASGIPARYRYGTIDVPIAPLMNWVGGVTSADAAVELLGQGGIPNSPTVSGGQITLVRLEHVWVEAWIDYVPSRGAVNRAGSSWVPLDPTYKQYQSSTGLAVQTNVPFDANGLLQAAMSGAEQNETEGWVRGINVPQAQAAFQSYRQNIYSYIQSHNPTATLPEILGDRKIVPQESRLLFGTLPYKAIAGPTYSTLPDQLRHQFKYSIYGTTDDRNSDTPLLQFTQSLPSLSGKQIGIWFVPATIDDANAIASLFPAVDDSSAPIPLSSLPTSMPALVSVVPQIRVGGEVVATGQAVRLGTELAARGGFTTYDLSSWDLSDDDTLVAGQTSALGLSIEGIDSRLLGSVQSGLQGLQDRITTRNFVGITDEDLVGNVLQSAILSYFVAVETLGRSARANSSVVSREALSYGLFHARLQPIKLLGITTQVRFQGGLIDVGHLRSIREAVNGDSAISASFTRMQGLKASSFEHSILEQLFISPDQCRVMFAPVSAVPLCPEEGVSAAKALTVAARNGQRIYQLSEDNASSLDSISLSDQSRQDIADALAAGKIAMVHEAPVTIGSWSGSGFAIIDPVTGAGAYLIEGGANGGSLLGFAMSGLESIADLLIPSAYASDDPNHKKQIESQAFIEMLDLIENDLIKAAGKVVKALKAATDVISIYQACDGENAVAEISLYTILQLMAVAVTAILVTIDPLAAVVFGVAFEVYFMEPFVEDSISLCKGSQ